MRDSEGERQALLGNSPTQPAASEPIGEVSSINHEAGQSIQREHSNAQLAVILSSIWAGVFLTALDSTIVATLLAPISSSFSSLSNLSWLASSYFIANAASQPVAGRFTDIFGRRAGLLVCNTAFGVGTLLCGLAGSEWVMILGRIIAGLGGGGIYAISTIVGSDLVPLRKRGIVQGLSNISYGIGTGLGGLFGGWINDVWSWEYAFLIQVPLIVLATLLVWLFVNVPIETSRKSALRGIDYLGTMNLVGAVVLLLLGLNAGGNTLPWSHWMVVTSICVSVALLAVFVVVEEFVAMEPVIPVKLLLKRTIAASCLTYFFSHAATFSILFYLPVYLQIGGLTTTEAGLRLIPQSACTALGSLLAGVAIRSTGKYILLNICAQSISILGYAFLATLKLGTPYWAPFVYLFLAGLGFGGILVVTLVSLISAVDREQQAVTTSASFVFRSTGSIAGISITSTVFQNVLRRNLRRRLGSGHGVDDLISRIRDRFSEVRHLSPALRQDALDSYGVALHAVFIVSLVMTVLGATCSLFIKQHKLHSSLSRP